MGITRRVVVGLSGGVDSAVSAYLLKKKGFDVIGVYMVNWDPVEEGSSHCNRTKDEADARIVAERLQIPFHTVNFVKEYWSEVFLGLLDNYRRGRTVVPDIQCNRSIKFSHLHNFAVEKLGADYVATGHYASTSYGDFQEKTGDDPIRLLCGMDPLKDQSYFLCSLEQKQLRRAIFPLGSLMKPTVRKIAKEQNLEHVAEKAESMGICFVGKKNNFEDFISQYIEPNPGKIVSIDDGSIIGDHQGIHNVTLGKRLTIADRRSHLGIFVAGLRAEDNVVLACEGSHAACLYSRSFLIQEPQWIAECPLDSHGRATVTCRIQRTHPPVRCEIQKEDGLLRITPTLPLRAVANGQMCVLYRDRVCLGGGEVERVSKTLADK